MISSCIKYANNTCAVWVHTFSSNSDAQCFPDTMYVYDKYGNGTPMDRLRIGDEITTPCGPEKVRSWLHRVPGYRAKYITLYTYFGSVTLSEYHNIAVNSSGNYLYAKDVKAGDTLIPGHQVQRITYTHANGMYAPYTACGSFYVGDNHISCEVQAFADVTPSI